MRASRVKRSKLTTMLLGCVEPSRTLSPTSTKIGNPMLPIIERFGRGSNVRGHKPEYYHAWSEMSSPEIWPRIAAMACAGLRRSPRPRPRPPAAANVPWALARFTCGLRWPPRPHNDALTDSSCGCRCAAHTPTSWRAPKGRSSLLGCGGRIPGTPAVQASTLTLPSPLQGEGEDTRPRKACTCRRECHGPAPQGLAMTVHQRPVPDVADARRLGRLLRRPLASPAPLRFSPALRSGDLRGDPSARLAMTHSMWRALHTNVTASPEGAWQSPRMRGRGCPAYLRRTHQPPPSPPPKRGRAKNAAAELCPLPLKGEGWGGGRSPS